VNPGKHGIFWSLIRDEGTAYPLRLMSGLDIRARTIWEMLGESGLDLCVVNVPTEYPPRAIRGFMVSGGLTPDGAEFTYPAEFAEEVRAVVPGYRCEIDYARLDLEGVARELERSIERRTELILHMMARKPWSLFFAVFTESDLAQHRFWACLDDRHPDHARFRDRHGDFVSRIYELLDHASGRILAAAPANTTTLVVSDHGFGPFYQSFSLARWLMDHGYLVTHGQRVRRLAESALAAVGLRTHARRAMDAVRVVMRRRHGGRDVRSLRDRDVEAGEQTMGEIDWTRTTAYFTSDYGVRLNLRGREPQGIVEPGAEEDRLRAEIMAALQGLRFSNGAPVFEAVMTREAAYEGPFIGASPDIVVPIAYDRAPPAPERWAYTMTHPTLQGTHTPLGVLIAAGHGVRAAGEIPAARIIDITPTILYALRRPLTSDMDGDVLLGLFDSRFQSDRTIVREGSSFGRGTPAAPPSVMDKGVEARLRALGYID
jgi:predicted AlkP superfamily phosphohydrolase/phosphomutase